MEFDLMQLHHLQPDSLSRRIDKYVQRREMPYGYDMPPPPADSGDYDMRRRESNVRYKNRDI